MIRGVNSPVVVITGSSEGIGAACARLFRARGARLSMIALEKSGPMLECPGDLAMAGDITVAEIRRQFIEETIGRFGRIDVLINNAGVGLYAPATGSSDEHTRYLFDLNVFAPLDLAKLVAPHMRRQKGGCIVNLGSIAGSVTLPWSAVYCAAKSALYSLSEGLRRELRRDGIHVATVRPCIVQTRFREHVLHGVPPARVRGMRGAVSAESVAAAVLRVCEHRRRRLGFPPWQYYPFLLLARVAPGFMDRYLDWQWLG